MKTPIIIKCFKNNGKLHRTWYNEFMIINNQDYFVVFSKTAKVVEGSNRQWFSSEPAITFFPKHEWFNVVCMFKEKGIEYYVNIASLPLLENGCIKYVDYDVDLKKDYNECIKVLDINEYHYHFSQMHYDKKIDQIVKDAVEKVKFLMENRLYPFNNEQNLALIKNTGIL